MKFLEINDSVVTKLDALLKELPKTAEKDLFRERNQSQLVAKSHAEALSHLIKILRTDFDTNTIESANAPWTFEYEIAVGETHLNEIAVLTRLFHPQEEGSISYGRYVRRSDLGKYHIWVDD